MTRETPAYLNLLENGDLNRRAQTAAAAMRECLLCPRRCRVDRTREARGYCHVGRLAGVGAAGPHPGEEHCLSGIFGSGTVFFSGCNLRCCFCQNFDLSLADRGYPTNPSDLAEIMLSLQRQGCHNLNLVTPSHVVPHVLSALVVAAERGLRLPIVYNSGGYDALEALQLLDGVVDIYMPDFKFWKPESGERYCHAPDYPEVARAAIREMHRQVGDLVIGPDGLATRGLLVRHLLMPEGEAETDAILRFLAEEISIHTAVNLMAQYHPNDRLFLYPELQRRVSRAEVERAFAAARRVGLSRFV
ncbi:radical SAM protein [bacterium]|nr:radical SAM protein [bacterium]